MIERADTPQRKQGLLEYLAKQIGENAKDLVGDMPYEIVGILKNEKLAGVICFLNYRRSSIEFHLCGSPGWLSRAEIKQLFTYVFKHLGCRRLWCLIRRNNKPSRLGAERLGFKVLGVAHDEFGEGKDGIMYSMRRSECKWIKD